jgi:hypothetical protein
MLKRSRFLVLGILVLFSLAAGSAHAQTAKCQAAKMKAAGKKASCELSVEAKAASKATSADFSKCVAKYQAAWTKAELGTCATTGDQATIETKVDGFVARLNSDIALNPPSKCQAAKLKAAGKRASCMLGVEAKALTTATTPDFTKCDAKFDGAFTKADAGSDCGATTGDAPGIKSQVTALDDDVACELDAGPACNCGGSPATLSFTTSLGSGNCGEVENNSGAQLKTLACNTLHTGGGGADTITTVPDYGTTKTKTSCCRSKFVALSAATSVDTGSNRNCSAAGCLYGPPLPIVTGASLCVINTVAQPAAGYAYCDAGSTTLDIPLSSALYLTLDSLPNRCNDSSGGAFVGQACTTDANCGSATGHHCVADPAVQPCPICNPNTLVCNGGPNNGMACTPGELLVTGSQWPTSHDCPPPSIDLIGALSIPYVLSTGTSSKTSVDRPSQNNVFCGFCADPTAGGTFHSPAVPCTSDADCASFTTGCSGQPCTACRQRTGGAFGSLVARTITETGTPAGPLSVGGAAMPATLADVFCVPPSFVGAVDAVGSLPGAGAVSISGSVQLLP